MILETLEVALGNRSYPIHIGRGLASELALRANSDRTEGRTVAVITDNHVAIAQKEFLQAAFGDTPTLVLSAGESTKSFSQLERCCQFLAESGLDRSGRVFAVGGGVIGDLAGFAAAAYLRGIGFYQVPTTVLAMVDSSVGGKTGINLSCGKNLVGAFHQPLTVYSDLDTLLTLTEREFNAGMAEIIKHGMLADADLFDGLERRPRLTASSDWLPEVIRRNCAIKASVVSADERELTASDGRALLNLGHTFGHAIEACAGYGTYLHGEAIAVGLILATRLSVELGYLDPSTVNRVIDLIRNYDLPVKLTEPLPVDALMAAARKDKKARAGKLRYVALRDLGDAVTVEGVAEDLVRELWETV